MSYTTGYTMGNGRLLCVNGIIYFTVQCDIIVCFGQSRYKKKVSYYLISVKNENKKSKF